MLPAGRDFLRKWFGISILIHMVGVLLNEGVHHYDEHFCIYEFAGFLNGLIPQDFLSHDYPLQMRAFLAPFTLSGFSKLFLAFGVTSPFFHAFLYRLVSAILGLYCQYQMMVWGWRELQQENTRRWFVIFTSVFFLFPYLHNHPSGEGWSSAFFFIAIATFFLKQKYFWVGAGLALAFQARYQVGLMIAGFGFWQVVIYRTRLNAIGGQLFGFFVFTAVCTAIDAYGYQQWTFAPWNYLKWQVIDGGAASAGVDPFWMYFKYLALQMPFPLGLLTIAGFFSFWVLYPRHVLTWISVPFFVAHVFLAHKEERYLFPLLPLLPLVLFLAYEKIAWKKLARVSFQIGFVLNILYLIGTNFRPLRTELATFRKLYPLSGVLYWDEKHPYEMANVVSYFYTPKSLTVKKLSGPQDLAGGVYYFKRTPDLPTELTSRCELQFTLAIDWLPQSWAEKFHKLAKTPAYALFYCK